MMRKEIGFEEILKNKQKTNKQNFVSGIWFVSGQRFDDCSENSSCSAQIAQSLFLFPPEIMKQKTPQKGNRWVNSLNIQQITQSLEQLKHMAIAKQPSGQKKYWSFSANCRYVHNIK